MHYYFAALFINVFGVSAYALRLPAIFLSLISLCVVWALTRRLFGPVAAVTALAAFAVTFWPVAFGRIKPHHEAVGGRLHEVGRRGRGRQRRG